MTTITIETWLNSGANIHSTYKVEFEVDADTWESMSDDEKDEYAKEYAWSNMDWGWRVRK